MNAIKPTEVAEIKEEAMLHCINLLTKIINDEIKYQVFHAHYPVIVDISFHSVVNRSQRRILEGGGSRVILSNNDNKCSGSISENFYMANERKIQNRTLAKFRRKWRINLVRNDKQQTAEFIQR